MYSSVAHAGIYHLLCIKYNIEYDICVAQSQNPISHKILRKSTYNNVAKREPSIKP